MIRTAIAQDAPAISAIYNHYVLNTIVTFEEQAVSADEIGRRVAATLDANLPWLVLEEAGKVLGYTYASKWKSRAAYRFSVETTVYLDVNATGRSLGKRLYSALIEALKPTPIHALIGGIALPNAPSIALHESLGFEKIGHFREVGWKLSQWIDVGYWELIL